MMKQQDEAGSSVSNHYLSEQSIISHPSDIIIPSTAQHSTAESSESCKVCSQGRDLKSLRAVTTGLRDPGHSRQLEPAGEVLEVAVTEEGVVVELHTLQTPGEHGLPAQSGEGVVLQLQPLQRLQTSEGLVPGTSTMKTVY